MNIIDQGKSFVQWLREVTTRSPREWQATHKPRVAHQNHVKCTKTKRTRVFGSSNTRSILQHEGGCLLCAR